eukprot:COSAG01_NODE_17418_length_1152_cov_60.556505_1_plen_170_part_00
MSPPPLSPSLSSMPRPPCPSPRRCVLPHRNPRNPRVWRVAVCAWLVPYCHHPSPLRRSSHPPPALLLPFLPPESVSARPCLAAQPPLRFHRSVFHCAQLVRSIISAAGTCCARDHRCLPRSSRPFTGPRCAHSCPFIPPSASRVWVRDVLGGMPIALMSACGACDTARG